MILSIHFNILKETTGKQHSKPTYIGHRSDLKRRYFSAAAGLLAAFCRRLTVKILSLDPSAAAKCHMPQCAKSGYSQF